MKTPLESLQSSLKESRQQLAKHPLYARLSNAEGLREFSRWHVFAVWDFMSLLKSLQSSLTCTDTPWLPVGNPETRFLINEIVVGEECDVDPAGRRISHFELYMEAMDSMGADTSIIRTFISNIQSGKSVTEALMSEQIPSFARRFVDFTFRAIAQPSHIQAAVFTFGREDLIPDMFIGMVRQISNEEPGFSLFRYYLERHIEVDGGHHGVLALQMVDELCGADPAKWEEAAAWANNALQERIRLWNGIAGMITQEAETISTS